MRLQTTHSRSAGENVFIYVLVSTLCWPVWAAHAGAEDHAPPPVPSTLAYTRPVEPHFVRALLQMTGFMALGFMWYVTTTDIVHDYDVGYRWPVFRRKLLGQALELDTNKFNTNFIGHPVGGTGYYTAARSNAMSVAESAAISLGGSLIWEYFGEVHEIVSANDMIVTPVAGVAIGESFFQLGAFFDRSSPALHNRVFAWLFTPLKSLNDQLDGRTLARSESLDARGFPRDEWHQFDLQLGAAAQVRSSGPSGARLARPYELRLSLASQLIRLPGYDGAAKRSLWFGDANASTLQLDLAANAAGLIDLEFASQFSLAGHWFRAAAYDASGQISGQGTLLALTMGFQYTLHDYDRDRAWPKDRISTVQPLGLWFEHRARVRGVAFVTRIAGGADFGGVRPYAGPAFRPAGQPVELPGVLIAHNYYFAAGGHVLASVSLGTGPVETSAKLRYEAYSALDVPLAIEDRRMLIEARVSVEIGSPGRLGLALRHRTRAGEMGLARAHRNETSLALDLGARY